MEVHHLVEKRLINALNELDKNLKQEDILSTPLNKAAHQTFTKKFRKQLPYGGTYTLEQVRAAVDDVYQDYPTLKDAVNTWINGLGKEK